MLSSNSGSQRLSQAALSRSHFLWLAAGALFPSSARACRLPPRRTLNWRRTVAGPKRRMRRRNGLDQSAAAADRRIGSRSRTRQLRPSSARRKRIGAHWANGCDDIAPFLAARSDTNAFQASSAKHLPALIR
jgi:hypothetical protein